MAARGPAATTTASSSAPTAWRARAATSTRWRARCAASCRVVCPDVVGRGESDRLADPAGYQIQSYVADMVTLLARLDATSVHWVGTSMGGLIGMVLAALPGSPIERLVLNDVGPAIDADGIARIGAYVGQPLDLGQRGRGRRLPADDLARLRPAQPRAVARADAADAASRRRALAPALRPGDRASPCGR